MFRRTSISNAAHNTTQAYTHHSHECTVSNQIFSALVATKKQERAPPRYTSRGWGPAPQYLERSPTVPITSKCEAEDLVIEKEKKR